MSLGVVGPEVAPLPPPPAKVFLERAECLLEWALDAVSRHPDVPAFVCGSRELDVQPRK